MSGDGVIDEDRSHRIKYFNIDTTSGQSGSPIFQSPQESDIKEDEKQQEQNNDIFCSFNEVIGVHTDGSAKRKFNQGTLITDKISKVAPDKFALKKLCS